MNVSSACNNYEKRNSDTEQECCAGSGESIAFKPLHASEAILDTALRQVKILLQPLAEKTQGAENEHVALIQKLIDRALAGAVVLSADEDEVATTTAGALNGLLRRYGAR
jgi:hypothetical protein